VTSRYGVALEPRPLPCAQEITFTELPVAMITRRIVALMTWLLTGGAGYIGGHIIRAMHDANLPVVVLDDLSTGARSRIPADVPLVEASVLDRARVVSALCEHHIRGVIHLAAKKAVAESVERPLLYYRENVTGLERLLDAMLDVGIDRLVFSSSCSVIGTPKEAQVTEDSPTNPESPYGVTKLVGEWMVRDVARATGLRYATLRYFNVAGAGAPELGDLGAFNLIPLTFRALTEGRPPQVFGDDYPTPDGSCIRDYIHVVDLARAHVAAVERLEAGPCAETYNVGRGQGASVKQVMETVRRAVGRDFEYVVTGRRPGDPPHIVGVVEKIEKELGWVAQYDLEDMIRSAWSAWQAAPADTSR
jgi:UDP-glucose 4-epimerase